MVEQPNNQSSSSEIQDKGSVIERLSGRFDKLRVWREQASEKVSDLHEGLSARFSSATESLREKMKNLPFRKRREQIENGEDLKNFLAEVRGKQIRKAADRRKVGVPAAFGLGVGAGVAKSAAKSELLVAGLEMAEVAPLVASGASIVKDIGVVALTKDIDIIAALEARYVKGKPGSKKTHAENEEGRLKKVGRGIVEGLSKLQWYSQTVERRVAERFTKTVLEEGSREERVLRFVNSRLSEIKNEGGSVSDYLGNSKRIREEVRNMLLQEGETDVTGHLVETFGFLTNTKTKNTYGGLSELKGFSGSNPDESVQNFESIRSSLEEALYHNLIRIKNIRPEKYSEYIDELSKHKWSTWRQLRYAAPIVGSGAVMAGVKAWLGVKAVDVVADVFQEKPEVPEVRESKAAMHEVDTKDVAGVVPEAAEVQESVPSVEDVDTETRVHLPTVSVADKAEDFFDQFLSPNEAPWDTGAKAGEQLASQIDMGDLKKSWMHGNINVPRAGAYRNFFGHWFNEGGPLDEDSAVRMAENLRESLLVDQENPMDMARLISEPLRVASSPEQMKEILTSMPKKDALNAVYYIYAEGLINSQNTEARQVIIDLIKSNT